MSSRFPARMELDGWVGSLSSVNTKRCSTGRLLRETQENYYLFRQNSVSMLSTHSAISLQVHLIFQLARPCSHEGSLSPSKSSTGWPAQTLREPRLAIGRESLVASIPTEK